MSMTTLFRYLTASGALAAALATGWYLGTDAGPGAATPALLSARPSPIPAGEPPAASPDTTAIPSPGGADPAAAPAPAVSAAIPDPAVLVTLQASLLAEQEARQALAGDLQRLRLTVRRLERQLSELRSMAATGADDSADDGADTPPRRLDVPSLVAVGFPPGDAEQLVWRWGEQQMAELYLREEARRDGWLDTDRYREAVAALRHGEGSLRQELAEADYEAMLYAIGQPNRLVIREVIPASPAQLAGLQDGDQLLRYDGVRIYERRELTRTMGAGDSEELVPVQVARGNRTVEVFLPRGPLGVMLGADSVAPGS